MANEKANAYIEQIRLIMDKQLDLVYEYHNSKDVDGCADDFPFFNLFVHFKMSLYETLLNDLYMQGCDMTALLEEVNGLPEFREMGVSIEATPDGLVFPHISRFAPKKGEKNYLYYKLELFPYHRYVMGLEYIIFKFAPYVIEKLYSEGESYPDSNFLIKSFCDSIVYSDEDWIDEEGNRVSHRDSISLDIQWKRFVEQIDYYCYCGYRRLYYMDERPALDEWYGSQQGSVGENLWDINVDKTFGACLVKNLGKKDEEIIDFLVSVPYLTEGLVRAFHDVKSGGCRLRGINEDHLEGTSGLHLTEKYKKAIKDKLSEYYSQGYVDATHLEDYGNLSYEGIYFHSLDALDRNKKYWDKEDEPEFLDKHHYLFLLRPYKDPVEYTAEDKKALANEPIDKEAAQKLVRGYMNFFISKLNIVAREKKKGVFKSPLLMEKIIRKTYRGMHKLYVSSAITIKTARADSKIGKEELMQKVDMPKKKENWYPAVDYYREVEFDTAQLKQISDLLGYELLERIE